MRRRTLAKLGGLIGAAAFAMTLAAPSAFAAKGIIKIHEGDWTGNLIDIKLAELILK